MIILVLSYSSFVTLLHFFHILNQSWYVEFKIDYYNIFYLFLIIFFPILSLIKPYVWYWNINYLLHLVSLKFWKRLHFFFSFDSAIGYFELEHGKLRDFIWLTIGGPEIGFRILGFIYFYFFMIWWGTSLPLMTKVKFLVVALIVRDLFLSVLGYL